MEAGGQGPGGARTAHRLPRRGRASVGAECAAGQVAWEGTASEDAERPAPAVRSSPPEAARLALREAAGTAAPPGGHAPATLRGCGGCGDHGAPWWRPRSARWLRGCSEPTRWQRVVTSPTRTTDVSIFPNTRSSIPRQSRHHHISATPPSYPPLCTLRGAAEGDFALLRACSAPWNAGLLFLLLLFYQGAP